MKLLLILLLIPFYVFPQNRHESVRRMNDIVSMMDEASHLNYTWYYDAVQLAEAIYRSKGKLNSNYFYSSQGTHSGTVYYTGMEKTLRFKELKADNQGRLPSYMADLIPWLEAKEQVLSNLHKPHNSIAALDSLVYQYITCTDSLYKVHNELTDYVTTKTYTADAQFIKAKAILKQQEIWFAQCHHISQTLAEAMQRYFAVQFPPNKSHAALQQAEQEMRLTISLLDDWERTLYKSDFSQNKRYDSILRQLNQSALSKDSLYLYKTRGYSNRNSGWWAHSRYRSFFTMLQSTVYWYRTANYSKQPYLKPELVRYNQFINGYDTGMEYYNRFTELFDGKSMITQSSCCLSPSEIDTAQNVLLKKPRLLYLFAYIDTSTENESVAPTTTVATHAFNDAQRIQKALPHHLIYLLDASSSMNEQNRLPALKTEARYLVGLQRQSDRISIISFASHARALLADKPCIQKSDIYAKIDEIAGLGSTKISEGISKAAHLADSCILKNGITKILLFTDGAFQLSKTDKKILKSLHTKNISFCLIYLGHTQKSVEDELKKICESISGRYYNANDTALREVLIKEASE